MAQTFFYAALLAGSIYVLVKSSYYVVRSLSAIARYLHVSEFVISFVLLAVATSLAELSVGVNAALSGIPEISLGDVLGTNISNLTLILGLVTVVGGGIVLDDYKHLKQMKWSTLFLISMPLLLLLDGSITRLDGLILLGLFLLHIFRIARNKEDLIERKTYLHSMRKHVHHTAKSRRHFLILIATFLVSVTVLLFAAFGIVAGVNHLADIFGVSEFVLGLFVVAVGTSLPELAIGLRSTRTGEESISVGNLMGAMNVNVTLVLGVIALIHPIEIVGNREIYMKTAVFSWIVLLLVFAMMHKKHALTRTHGFILLGVYICFLAVQLL